MGHHVAVILSTLKTQMVLAFINVKMLVRTVTMGNAYHAIQILEEI